MAGEVILFPDAEALAVAYLKSRMPVDVKVATKVPNPRPDKLIKVTGVGGSRLRLNADSAMMAFECWAKTEIEASEIARIARAHIQAMAGEEVGGVWVFKVRDVGRPTLFPDPNTALPRYQFSVAIDLKGSAL